MPVDTLPEKSGFSGRSPRISFSHELVLSSRDKHITAAPVQKPSVDFDFRTLYREHESSTADELFSDGKLIPQNIVQKTTPTSKNSLDAPPSSPQGPEKEVAAEDDGKVIKNDKTDEKQTPKSFWKFMRSKSFGGYGKNLCPLLLLSRSNSTGSPLNCHKQQNSQKNNAASSPKPAQKPPLRKCASGNKGNNVRVGPVLHVPTGNFFGLGSVFMSGKDKSKRK